jgi:hypothetical protein
MRNMPMAIRRPVYKGRGAFYTQYASWHLALPSHNNFRYAVTMRCARSDQSTCTMTLHYLSNGSMRLRVSVRKQDLMIPLVVVLNALMPDLYDQGNFSHAISTGTPRDEGSKQSSSQPPCFLSVVNLTTVQVFYPINLQPKLIPWRYWAPCVPAFFARISRKMLTIICLDYSF